MKRDIWIFLFAIGLILFGWPIMSIFKHSLSIYLFLIWIIYIALIFIASIFTQEEDKRD